MRESTLTKPNQQNDQTSTQYLPTIEAPLPNQPYVLDALAKQIHWHNPPFRNCTQTKAIPCPA